MSISDPGRKVNDTDEYREIALSVMRINERYDFDIHLKIKDDFRLFAAKGALFTEQHKELLRKGSTKLFVRYSDWERFEDYRARYLTSILTDPKVSVEVKAEVAFSSSMKSIREVFRSTDAKAIARVEQNAEAVVKLILNEEDIMESLIWINSHDHFTYQHSVKVGIYATALSLKLFNGKLTHKEMAAMSAGFFLHDVGMAQVPLKILDKKAPLSPAEWGVVRMHPMWGYDRLLETGHLTPEAAAVVLSHHERNDGSGYPFAREGDGIPIYAKICAIADTFESLIGTRPYWKAYEPFDALKIMQSEMSNEFEPEVFRAFILLLGPKS